MFSLILLSELSKAHGERKKLIPIIYKGVDYKKYENGPGVDLAIGKVNQFFYNGDNYQELLSKLRIAIKGSDDDTDSGIPIVIQPTPQYIPPGPDVNVEQLRKEVKAVIQRNYCKITDLDDENLEPIAGELSSVNLISRPIRRSPSYKSIVNEIESILDCNRTVEELQDTCKKFLKAFKKVEGAASNVATTLEKEWNVAIKEKFYFDFIVS
jgi:translation elongation factor EF-1beta